MDKSINSGVFELGDKLPDVFSAYFVGQAYLKPLSSCGVNIANVTFSPKCRNNWHVHHGGGQILLVTSGQGWYQEFGKAPRKLNSGDVVEILPEVKHWHGAGNGWFSHLAVEVPSKNGSTEWLEKVSDKYYDEING